MKHNFRFLTLQIILFVFGITSVNAQVYFTRNDSIVVTQNGDTLSFPWVGGLNNPQFWAADINNDGIKDLVIFERGSVEYTYSLNGNKVLTFINHGTPNKVDYTYAPEYQQYFPGMSHYMVMVDMNCDGVDDILTSTGDGAIMMYLGHFDGNNKPYYSGPDTLKYNSVIDNKFYPITFLYTGIPAAVDVDGDGDIDILAFDNFSNAYINLYKNMSVENTGNCSYSTLFRLTHYCWGDMAVNSISSNQILLDVTCPFRPYKTGGPRHSGGSICAFDQNGDGQIDLLLGDISYNVLGSVLNEGTSVPDSGHMVAPVDSTFPSYDRPIDVYVYPAAFYLDVDNDGMKDLVVAPNNPPFPGQINSKDVCVWEYKNTSATDTSHFHFQTDSFMVNKMLDMGTGAYPAFVDIDGDGLKDLIIGNSGYFVNPTTLSSKLEYFRNVGTNTNPSFQLSDPDFAHLSTVMVGGNPINAAAPAFGDMDGDGDIDMMVGDYSGQIQYFENTAGPGNMPVYTRHPTFSGINVGGSGSHSGNSTPFIFDVNGDSLPDLVIGCKGGNVQYFQNKGSRTNPSFNPTPTNFNFGRMDVRTIYSDSLHLQDIVGFSSPVITTLDSTGKLYVLVGCEEGSIYEYEFDRDSIYFNLTDSLSSPFNLITKHFSGIDEGEFTHVTVGQLTNNATYQMITGNYRGGLSFYQGDLSTGINNIVLTEQNNIRMEMFPNPADNQVTLEWQLTGMHGAPEIEITDMLGRRVLYQKEGPNINGNITLDVSQFAKGLYNCRLIVGDHYAAKKLMIQ